MMVLDWTISLGNILTIATVIASVMGLVYNMKTDIQLLQNDMEHVQSSQKSMTEAFNQLGKVLTSVAVQDARINSIDKKIDELAHGRGFVK